jgi:protein TonB
MEGPGKAYRLSLLLAVWIHAAVIFGWQGRSDFQPAEHGVVNGESAIKVALIAAVPETPPTDEITSADEMLTTPETVQIQEPSTEISEQSEPEPPATEDLPLFNTVQESPEPERTRKTEVKPALRPTTAAKPKTTSNRERAPAQDHSRGKPGTDSLARSAGSQTSKPAYLYNPHPSYPEAARKGRLNWRRHAARLDKRKGRVSAVSLVKSSGYALLDDRAREAVQRWIFRPTRRDGKAVATQVEVPVRFSLDR